MHGNQSKVYMKHEKVGVKYQCKVCAKEYTHSAKLKKHYIKQHTLEQRLAQDIECDELYNKIQSKR
jgi:hypothetical protein